MSAIHLDFSCLHSKTGYYKKSRVRFIQQGITITSNIMFLIYVCIHVYGQYFIQISQAYHHGRLFSVKLSKGLYNEDDFLHLFVLSAHGSSHNTGIWEIQPLGSIFIISTEKWSPWLQNFKFPVPQLWRNKFRAKTSAARGDPSIVKVAWIESWSPCWSSIENPLID